MNIINFKKIIYLILSVTLWILIALIIYGLLTLIVIKNQFCLFLNSNIHFFGQIYSPLSGYVLWLLLATGAVGGYFIGLRWWQWVYVEKKHWKHWRKHQ